MSNPRTRACAECGESFTPQRYKNGKHIYCSKPCTDRAWDKRNPGARAARNKAWREANKERTKAYQREHHLKKKFGLTLEDYQQMLDEQGGRCAICRKPPERASTTRGDHLFVDHDHVTGANRGLLCHHCNALLGHAEDSPTLLRSALHYLETTTYASAVE